LKEPESQGGAANPVVDLEQLQSACDGSVELLRELVGLYFGQAAEIMAGLEKAIQAEDVPEVDHLSHKLAGSSLACGMSSIVPPLRQMEHNAKEGHLRGAPDCFAQAAAQLEIIRRYMDDYLRHNPAP
jgi:HPt (histidine-containing phosphotransfer) domain-containing protein